MDRRPRFEYGVSSAFEGTISSPSWLPIDETIGGQHTSAAGYPAAYEVRRDDLVSVTLWFQESEWAAVRTFVRFGQSQQSFVWFPDADEITGFEVYLERPAMGEPITPTRLGGFPRVFELTLILRGVSTAPWTPYFPA